MKSTSVSFYYGHFTNHKIAWFPRPAYICLEYCWVTPNWRIWWVLSAPASELNVSILSTYLTSRNSVGSHLPAPWSRVLLEKLTGFQLVQKFPTFYGSIRFITAFTSARHLSLSWASSIQSIPPTSHFMNINLNIILPSTPGFLKWFLSLRFPHQSPVYTSPLPHTYYMPSPSHSRFDHPNNTYWVRSTDHYVPPCVAASIPLCPRPS